MSLEDYPIIIRPGQPEFFQQQNLPFPSEPFLYLKPGTVGYFTHMVRYREMISRSYPMRMLPEVLRCADARVDNYITPQQYIRKNRRLVNLWQINAAFADLDTYTKPELRGLTPEGLAFKVMIECQDKRIPIPSVILYSGRGLQVKWIFERPLPRQALPRWNAVQRFITASLKGLGADFNSIDGSRVLRLEQTVNTKTGEMARVLWPEKNRDPVLFDFDLLAFEILPFTREQLQEARVTREARKIEQRARTNQIFRFNAQTLAWARVQDIRKLAHLRGWTEGNPDGHRDPFVFVGAVFCSWLSKGNPLFWETEALAKEFSPTWNHRKLMQKVSHLYRMAEQGRRYKYSNPRLVEVLEIEPGEERQMTTIISREEKARRRRIREGRLTRTEYEARMVIIVSEKQNKALELRQKGLSYRQIASEMGVGERTAWRLVNSTS